MTGFLVVLFTVLFVRLFLSVVAEGCKAQDERCGIDHKHTGGIICGVCYKRAQKDKK